MQDQVGSPQPFHARVGQDPSAAGQVRVGDDGDVHAEGPVAGPSDAARRAPTRAGVRPRNTSRPAMPSGLTPEHVPM